MADARSTRCTKVQHLCARCNEDFVHATQHARGKLTPEWIPHAILGFRALRAVAPRLDRDALLAVHGLAGDEIFGDEHGLLALGDEDPLVLVWLDDDLRTTPGPTAPHAPATATTGPAASATAAAARPTPAARLHTPTYPEEQ